MGNLSISKKLATLDRKVLIKTTTTSQSDSGAVIETFSDLANVWANVGGKGGSEKFVTEKEVSFNKKHFTIRYRTDFDEKARLVYESEEYDIISINEVDGTRRRFLIIVAERRE